MLGTAPSMDHVEETYQENAAENLAMWHKMRPLRVENFQYFWDLFYPDKLMTDIEKAEFKNKIYDGSY